MTACAHGKVLLIAANVLDYLVYIVDSTHKCNEAGSLHAACSYFVHNYSSAVPYDLARRNDQICSGVLYACACDCAVISAVR